MLRGHKQDHQLGKREEEEGGFRKGRRRRPPFLLNSLCPPERLSSSTLHSHLLSTPIKGGEALIYTVQGGGIFFFHCSIAGGRGS